MERTCRYVLRPAASLSRLATDREGRVVMTLWHRTALGPRAVAAASMGLTARGSEAEVSQVAGRQRGAMTTHITPLPTGRYGPQGGAMRTLSPDTTPEAEAWWIAKLRALTPGERAQRGARMTDALCQAVLSRLRTRYPQADERELQRRLAAIWMGPELARKVLGIEPDQELLP